MAEYRCYMKFGIADSKTVTYSYPSKNAIASSDIGAVMDSFITNGAIFKKVPLTKQEAYIVATTKSSIEIPS